MRAVGRRHQKGVLPTGRRRLLRPQPDLKLENLLLASVDSLDDVRIADFGLAQYFRPGYAIEVGRGGEKVARGARDARGAGGVEGCMIG